MRIFRVLLILLGLQFASSSAIATVTFTYPEAGKTYNPIRMLQGVIETESSFNPNTTYLIFNNVTTLFSAPEFQISTQGTTTTFTYLSEEPFHRGHHEAIVILPNPPSQPAVAQINFEVDYLRFPIPVDADARIEGLFVNTLKSGIVAKFLSSPPASPIVSRSFLIDGIAQSNLTPLGTGFYWYPDSDLTEGMRYFQVSVTDTNGVTFSDQSVVFIDVSGPKITASFNPSPNSNGWHNSETTATFIVTDLIEITSTLPGPRTFSTEGIESIVLSAEDRLGNTTSKTFTAKIDRINPEITSQVSITPNDEGWYYQFENPIITFTGTDSGSGIDFVTPNVTVTSEGANQIITGIAKDLAGNEVSTSITINKDNTPPTITSTLVPEANEEGWHNTEVTAIFYSTDTLSGLSWTFPFEKVFKNEVEGLRYIAASKDKAENYASTEITLNIDKTPPTITSTISPEPNAAGWHNTDVTAVFYSTDTLSGLFWTFPFEKVFSEEANGLRYVAASRDKAENYASTEITLNIDKTAPAISASASPTANENGWHNGPVTVSFSAVDQLSGLAGPTPPQTVVTEGLAQSIIGTATDIAGNSASVEFLVSLDVTGPTIHMTTPTEGETLHNAFPTFGGSLSDSLSGINADRVYLLIDGSTQEGLVVSPDLSFTWTSIPRLQDGLHVLEIKAYDFAGNDTSLTRNFTVVTDDIAPVITFTVPTEGQTIGPLDTITGTITEEGSGIDQNQTSILIDGQSFFGNLVITGSTFIFSPGENILNGNHTVELITQDLAGNKTSQLVNFVVATPDNTPPVITFTSPEQGQIFNTTPFLIEGTLFDNIAIDTDLTFMLIDGTTVPGTITDTSFSYSVADISTGLHTVEVHAFDTKGNCSAETVEFIFSDIVVTPPDFDTPAIQIVSPTDGSVLNSNQVTVQVSSSDGVNGEVSVNGVTATTNGGIWERSITLVEGENLITATGRDDDYNFTHNSIKVIVDTQAPTFELLGPTTPGGLYQTGGDIIRVHGFVFDDNIASIEIGTNASVNPVLATITDETFEAFVPVDEATNQITLTFKDLANNITTSTFDISVDFSLTPTIVEVIPETYGGSINGGEKVQIIGSNFRTGMTAKIAGLPLTDFKVLYDGLAEGLTPAVASTGVEDVTLHDTAGTIIINSPGGFEYKPTFTISGLSTDEITYTNDPARQLTVSFTPSGFVPDKAIITISNSQGTTEKEDALLSSPTDLTLNLADGENSITINLVNDSTGESASVTALAESDIETPSLTLDSRLVNKAFATENIVLFGDVSESETKVIVDGANAEVKSGKWYGKVSLSEGTSRDINVTIEDKSGNKASYTFNTIRAFDYKGLIKEITENNAAFSSGISVTHEMGSEAMYDSLRDKLIGLSNTYFALNSFEAKPGVIAWRKVAQVSSSTFSLGSSPITKNGYIIDSASKSTLKNMLSKLIPILEVPISTFYGLQITGTYKYADSKNLANNPTHFYESDLALRKTRALENITTSSYSSFTLKMALDNRKTLVRNNWDNYLKCNSIHNTNLTLDFSKLDEVENKTYIGAYLTEYIYYHRLVSSHPRWSPPILISNETKSSVGKSIPISKTNNTIHIGSPLKTIEQFIDEAKEDDKREMITYQLHYKVYGQGATQDFKSELSITEDQYITVGQDITVRDILKHDDISGESYLIPKITKGDSIQIMANGKVVGVKPGVSHIASNFGKDVRKIRVVDLEFKQDKYEVIWTDGPKFHFNGAQLFSISSQLTNTSEKNNDKLNWNITGSPTVSIASNGTVTFSDTYIYSNATDGTYTVTVSHVDMPSLQDSTTLKVVGFMPCPEVKVQRLSINLFELEYGHWWIENGSESYGWWPKGLNQKMGSAATLTETLWNTITGVDGELNGISDYGGDNTEDPHHGDTPEESIPVFIYSNREKANAWDDAVDYATTYLGGWSWPFGTNCRNFQEAVREAGGYFTEAECRRLFDED